MKSLVWIAAVVTLVSINGSYASDDVRYPTQSKCAEKIVDARKAEARIYSEGSLFDSQMEAIRTCQSELGSSEVARAMAIGRDCLKKHEKRWHSWGESFAGVYHVFYNGCMIAAFEEVAQPRSTVHDDE